MGHERSDAKGRRDGGEGRCGTAGERERVGRRGLCQRADRRHRDEHAAALFWWRRRGGVGLMRCAASNR